MNEQALWLDGNALAGLLQEVFATELTDAPHGCASCGAVRPIGAHRLYRGAGLVLRCPDCSGIALVVATAPDRHLVHLAGTWRMEMSRSG
jgi:uncharacterized protein DUF6510